MTMTRYSMLAVVAVALVVTGCSDVDDDTLPDDQQDETGAQLVVDFQGDTDVAGFEYTISECKGSYKSEDPEVVAHKIKELEDLTLPGMIPEFENDPFDEGSSHLFADYFTTLPAGCYDVEVQPVDKYDNASSDCDVASAKGVEVSDGETTEVLLISQCSGEERGSLDVVASLNHPPTIDSMKLDKFQHECTEVKVCATASDPDGDPIEFEWKHIGGPELLTEIQTSDPHSFCDGSCDFEDYDEYLLDDNSTAKECAVVPLGEAGEYQFKLTVYDLYWEDGKMTRFADSSASLKFPIYATDIRGEECPPKDEDGNKIY